MSKFERTIDELYADDPMRADAEVFGRKTDVSRRGFQPVKSPPNHNATFAAIAKRLAIKYSHNRNS